MPEAGQSAQIGLDLVAAGRRPGHFWDGRQNPADRGDRRPGCWRPPPARRSSFPETPRSGRRRHFPACERSLRADSWPCCSIGASHLAGFRVCERPHDAEEDSRTGRHDGRGQDIPWPPPGRAAGGAVPRRRSRDRGGGRPHRLRDFRQIRRALFPRRRAAGDRPPAGRGAACAGDGRRRLHGRGHPRRDEGQRLHRLAEGAGRRAAVAGEKARHPPPAARTAIRRKPSRSCLRCASRSMPRPTSRWNAPTNRITARWTASWRRCANGDLET